MRQAFRTAAAAFSLIRAPATGGNFDKEMTRRAATQTKPLVSVHVCCLAARERPLTHDVHG